MIACWPFEESRMIWCNEDWHEHKSWGIIFIEFYWKIFLKIELFLSFFLCLVLFTVFSRILCGQSACLYTVFKFALIFNYDNNYRAASILGQHQLWIKVLLFSSKNSDWLKKLHWVKQKDFKWCEATHKLKCSSKTIKI